MKVKANNDDIKKLIRHPVSGAFRDDGTAEWPDDTYTFRRIADGDVTVVTEEESQQETVQQEAVKKSKTSKEA